MKAQFILFLIFSFLFSFAYGQRAEKVSDACSLASKDFVSQCVEVPASYQANRGLIKLYVEIYKKFEPKKHSIFFINGGPGGSTNQFTLIERLRNELSPSYNLVFFYPRGVENSRAASGGILDFNSVDYTAMDNIHDIETIRNKLVGNQPIILFGHSFGAHLALAYATLYPKNVSHVIALNGGLDELGFLLQPIEKSKVLENIASKFKPDEINELFLKLQSGNAINSNGEPISLAEFMAGIFGSLSTYNGQSKTLPQIFNDYIDRNVRQKTDINKTGRTKSENVEVKIPGIEMAINTYIICHDFMPQSAIDNLVDLKVKAAAQLGKETICANSPVRHKDRSFNFTSKVKNLTAKVLLVGGAYDPLVPIAVQERDFNLLKNFKKQVQFLSLDKVGHDPLTEAPDTIWPVIKRFLP
jgi:pimeloyl-ACP methyl ester carboxylesterase